MHHMALLSVFKIVRSNSFSIQPARWISEIKHIQKLLIANRGEIACRIMKTAKKLGVQTVAVYSDADRNSMHVAMADEAYRIGPANSQESYLRADKIISVAKLTCCDAIHPGYGFLSENTEFAEICSKSDIIFVGPPASAIRDMGIKSTSKKIMSAAGVPIINGYHGEDQSTEKLLAEAHKIGFPIMIKAVRGGGGKGMRIAMSVSEFLPSLESARNESMKAFGDDNVLLEQFISDPRHVEVQVFADTYGNAVHLFERDCSVQRRHQKIIEEAPAPHISKELRNELGMAAVRAAKAVNYVGAGTVEFILDRHTHSFHFMEMNTRLQVEHPITEMITGTDLVEWQLNVAAGYKLPLTQEEIKLNGHAFEARIYAEDPNNHFLPRPGPLIHMSTPVPSSDVRVETGVREGDEVTIHYDPMIAKLVVWGENRIQALSKLSDKLTEINVAGVDTNMNFLLNLSRHPEFMAGHVHTGFIDEHRSSLFPWRGTSDIIRAKAALAVLLHDREMDIKKAKAENNMNDPYISEANFRINHELIRKLKFHYSGEDFIAKIRNISPHQYQIYFNGEWKDLYGQLIDHGKSFELICYFDGIASTSKVVLNEEYVHIFDKEGSTKFFNKVPKFVFKTDTSVSDMSSNAGAAPMPGILEKIFVKAGDVVKKGDPLFVIIAMKMEYVVKAVENVTVKAVHFNAGDSVSKNKVIVQFEEKCT